jgi:maltooligosyltrehalose trehalohydrolase
MHTFEVWAPGAATVAVRIDGRDSAMARRDAGYCSVSVADVQAGAGYSFILDNGQPLPDPRSAWQPCGVHGPSRLVDHSSFEWSDQHWQARPLSGAIVYELHIGTFTPAGTFRAAIECLEHLVQLGVTHIELMPIAEFSGDWGWGYDGVDLYAPHHAYGAPDDLKALVDACHGEGLAVLLDVVYNHFGPAGNYAGRFGRYTP